MTAGRSQKVEDLFAELLQREPAQRQAFLARVCADDPDLLSELRPLLAAHEAAGDFLEKPLPDTLGIAVAQGCDSGLIRLEEEAQVGRKIGPWKLSRKIAAGGMGTVYVASRDDGLYKHQAAIKLIRPSVRFDDSKHRGRVIRQFRREQQHLANLNHPNIAKLLDGGTTEDGLPYLVMEYIHGLPITEHCEKHGFSVAARLRLFRTVCLAVQHAHGKLIAHLDLKPSNILVTPSPHPGGEPAPRLLDFGIAKLLKEDDFSSGQATTSLDLRPMTLDYASPEQVRGEETTTLSDVYSLGVVLYEVLTGRLPYEVNKYSAEWIISEQAPKRPSLIRTSIDREVDTIVLKAMAKDPARRYQSAAALAEDLERYLAGRPIMAHPPSVPYQIGKFITRYQWEIVATVFLLACGLATGLWIGTLFEAAAETEALDKQKNLASRLFYAGRSSFLKREYVAAEGIFRLVLEIEDAIPAEVQRRPQWGPAERREWLGRAVYAQAKYEAAITHPSPVWPYLLRTSLPEEKLQEAERYLLDSYKVYCRHLPPEDSRRLAAKKRLVSLYEDWGRPQEAAKFRMAPGESVQIPTQLPFPKKEVPAPRD